MHGAKAEDRCTGWQRASPLGTGAAAHYLAPSSTDLPPLAAGALRMGRLSSAG
jgi:hypothetical protein